MPGARAASCLYRKGFNILLQLCLKGMRSQQCNAPEFLVNHILSPMCGFEGSLPIREFLKSCKSSYGGGLDG